MLLIAPSNNIFCLDFCAITHRVEPPPAKPKNAALSFHFLSRVRCSIHRLPTFFVKFFIEVYLLKLGVICAVFIVSTLIGCIFADTWVVSKKSCTKVVDIDNQIHD